MKKSFRPQRGLTLIELMVSLALGLFVVLAIVSVMVTQEGIRRNATTGSDASSNAAVGMLILERSIKNGGYGLSPNVGGGLMDTCAPLGVTGSNTTRGSNTFTFSAFEFAPVVINPTGIPAGDAGSQSIRVTYSGNHVFGASSAPAKATTPDIRVESRAGLNAGDLVVLGQPALGCVFRQLTAMPNNLRCSTGADVARSDVVEFSNANYKSDYSSCAETVQTYNTTAVPFTFVPTTGSVAGLRIFTLGQADRFQSVVYAVRRGQLTMCNFMVSRCDDAMLAASEAVWVPVVDDVVSLRIQYGVDTNADLSVDSWNAVTPSTIAGLNGIIAVRLAVTTRAKAYNKEEVVIDSGAGKNSPQWFGGDVSVSHLPDWKHYRYVVNETIVPLKNVIWRD
ncbi:MAG: PilW family protein [Polaromonas sp.]|nr:PilW family protein [Polaromonas sp.]